MIVAGFGFRTDAREDSLQDALSRARGCHTPQIFATLESKLSGLDDLAETFGIPAVGIEEQCARRQKTATQSQASTTAKGIGSVAEATALAAAGPNAKLLGPRCISADRMATCAIAIGDK